MAKWATGPMENESVAIARRRGKWSQKDVPHLGWTCVGEYDAKEDGGETITCEMCEAMEVRFVHIMANVRYPDQLHCGCVCAGHMSGEKKESEERDRRIRSRSRRRANFHSRKGWKLSQAGTPYIDIDGFHLLIARKKDGRFQVGAKGPLNTAMTWGPRRYATIEEAKKGCFDALEFLEGKQRQVVRAATVVLLG